MQYHTMNKNIRPELNQKKRSKRLKYSYALIIFGILSCTTLCFAKLSGSLDEKAILERIKPEGSVTIEAGSTGETTAKATATGDVGQQIYDKYCHTCHGTGLAGAPKFGDKGDWAPRISTGMETLVKHAIMGIKAMPPKGTCTECSDEDIKKTVEFMVNKSK